MFIIYLLIIGLIAGFVARAVVPGKDALGIVATIILGIVGSFVGGAIAAIFNSDHTITEFNTSGIILSIVGAIIALLVYNAISRRSHA